VSEKVGTERLIHKGRLRRMAGRQSLVSQSGDFEVNPIADWEPVKQFHEVLNRHKSTTDIINIPTANPRFSTTASSKTVSIGDSNSNNDRQPEMHGLCKSSGVVCCIASLPIDSLPMVSY